MRKVFEGFKLRLLKGNLCNNILHLSYSHHTKGREGLRKLRASEALTDFQLLKTRILRKVRKDFAKLVTAEKCSPILKTPAKDRQTPKYK